MKVYYVSVDEYDYDEFDAIVVVAENEDRALEMARNGNLNGGSFFEKHQGEIYVEEVDLNTEQVVLASFNAG